MRGWSIQLPTGEFLDLPENFQLPLELNNQVFSSGDTGTLPGSFSFPTEAANTGAMKRLFRDVHLPTSATARRTAIEGVWVYANGMPLMYGRLTVRSADENRVKFDIVANPLASLKDVNLPDLDYEGERSLGVYTMAGYQTQTALFPEDWDFAFFPVVTGDILSIATIPDENWLNYYDQSGSAGFQPMGSGGVTPFVKLEYILKRMFASYGEGFEFRNDWQRPEDYELRRLYLYNNVDARILSVAGQPTFPGAIDLKKHVPKIKSTEMLKKVCAQWNLGLFTNVFDRTVKLAPVVNTLTADAAHDWTTYRAGRATVEYNSDAPRKYAYDEYEPLPPGAPKVADMRRFTDFQAFAAAGTIAEEYVYIECANLVLNQRWYNYQTSFQNNGWGGYPEIETEGGGEDYNPGMAILAGGFDYYRAKGGISTFVDNAGEWKYTPQDYALALMFYRGIQSYNWPVSGNSPYLYTAGAGVRADITENNVVLAEAKRSLNWEGEYGLYENYHQKWNELLRNGKQVTQTFALPVPKFVKFNFDQKVRVGSMEYIVKKLRVSKLVDARVIVEATMLSVI